MQLVNDYGNNDAFANFPDGDPFTDGARVQYGTTVTHGTTDVDINTGVEGLYPLLRPFWPAPPGRSQPMAVLGSELAACYQTVVGAFPARLPWTSPRT